MNINILLATTVTILLLRVSNAAHMSTNLTASFTIGLGITTFDVIKQLVMTSISQSNKPTSPLLFNFTDPQNTLSKWIEVSDTVRVEGRSKAILVPHIAYNYRSAIFFYLLNPQPSGACFAGVDYILDTWDLSQYTGVVIDLHRQGQNTNFKLFFYGNCSEIFTCESYESFFETSGEREQIKLPFSTFKAYFRGELRPESPPLDITQLSRFGIQTYGGIFAPKKQSGPGSIEIFTISAYKEDQMPA
ncbi:unnamed protein product [Schistosoma rodhaini]|uniref:CIA30 domain-containing protein n=1 Tax=Schistosoma rodhaini TaxID=6188 RepID=A0A183QML2_9TREM|nr:unnamed protein product [Schistosoma rodhaini]CAH8533545.1 unnamed protein product [Schistosoma rodhaini]